MKKIAFLLLPLFLSISCADNVNSKRNIFSVKGTESYSDSIGAKLNLESQKWFFEENSLGGIDVGVTLKGSIVGDSVTIRGFGDGLISDGKIELNSRNEFSGDYYIYFTVSSNELSRDSITANSLIMVYNAKDTLKVKISSVISE
ncbi:MAG: hypothetical protein PHH37_00825 [Paludibacter sp.]|nr:hypothetical protein [Paludibacter sp.]